MQIAGTEFFTNFKKEFRKKTLNYLRNIDTETALNALFVLEYEHQHTKVNLRHICQNLNIDKGLFIKIAF